MNPEGTKIKLPESGNFDFSGFDHTIPGSGQMTNPGSLKDLTRTPKFHRVMREFGKKKLKSSSGQPVTNSKQAFAIAVSEARRHPNKR